MLGRQLHLSDSTALGRRELANRLRITAATLAVSALCLPRTSAQSSIHHVCTRSEGGAHISVLGTTQFLVDGCEGNLVLSVTDVPEGAIGVLVYGRGMTPSVSWRNGSMCVGGGPRRSTPLRAGPNERSLWISLDGLRLRERAETLGIDWTFQLWHRNGKVLEVSDALALRLGPPALLLEHPSVPMCRDGELFFPRR